MNESNLKIFTDGGSRGNPGPAAIGVVIFKNGQRVDEISHAIGEATNNIAEYSALDAALDWIVKNEQNPTMEFFLDSELVVKQMAGEYKVKDENLKKIYFAVRSKIVSAGGQATFTHIVREKNSEADALVNKALDK